MMSRQPQSKLVFVVGVWRSGTSLLHALLHHHPQIALMYEAEPFGLYPPTADYIFPGNWAVQLEFFNQAISRHRLTAAALPKKASGRDCLLAMLHAWAANKDALVMGDKLTNGHARLPQIARVFPEADFIVIWRDPLDSCRSVVQAARQNRFFGRKGILTETFFGGARLAEGVLKLRLAGRAR